MTLNNVLNRIKAIALSHKQIRSFKYGLVQDFFTDHTTKYPACLLQDNGGSISSSRKQASLSFRMFLMDLVHVAADSKDNEQDVHSDMVSIALDIVTQMNDANYQDWKISADNNLQLVVENDNDLHAGCIIDFTVSVMFKQDRCQIPTDLLIDQPTNDDFRVYDEKYTATGNEGSTLTTSGAGAHVPAINGKKLLLITRESQPIYKVSNFPDSVEYTWNNTIVELGTVTNPGERFLFLYRNY